MRSRHIPLVDRFPCFINLLECHVVLFRDRGIGDPLQGFLGFAPGGIGSDAHVIFSCHPRLCPVPGQFGNAAGSVCALSVFPRLLRLTFPTGGAEYSAVRQWRLAFYALGHIFLAFPGRIWYHKSAECPYCNGWVVFCAPLLCARQGRLLTHILVQLVRTFTVFMGGMAQKKSKYAEICLNGLKKFCFLCNFTVYFGQQSAYNITAERSAIK